MVSFGHNNYLSAAMKQPKVQSLLTSASDLRRVKLKRSERGGKSSREVVQDVQSFWDNKKSQADDIWLQDGDVVEVPDK
jgi:hypothetical protein